MKKSEKAGFYPILINLQRFNCLVVGGGKVASRKVVSLLNFNAYVTVISPRISKPILELGRQGKIKIIKKHYSENIVDNFGVVFCATDNPEISRLVRKDCTDKGVLLNVADEPGLCDFIMPANVIRGDLIISISSQGKAPFYTRKMKNKIEKLIDPVHQKILKIAGEFRKKVLEDKKLDSKEKARIFKLFASKDWENIIKANGSKSLKKYINDSLKEFNSL